MSRSLSTIFLPIIALATAALPVTAQTGVTVKTIVNNGPIQNRYDIVILGDGYISTEQSKFDADCTKVANALFAKEPYKTFKQFFNVHTVFRASAQSGATHPDVSPPITRNTAYGASYNTGGTARCLYITKTSQALQDAAAAPATEGRVVVIVNDSRYGGCASTFAVSYNGSSMNEVQIHEIGHSFASLADEYDYPNGTYTGSEPSQVNVTKDSTGAKWKHWWGTGGISSSAFEGARYYQKGIYRPAANCLMRALGIGLCKVCEEQIVRSAYRTVSSVDNPNPASMNQTLASNDKKTFSFALLAPSTNTTAITWSVDSKVVQTGGTSYLFDASKYTTGVHALAVEVKNTTAFVRSDPQNLLTKTFSWRLDVQGPAVPDLVATAVVSSKSSLKPGETLSLSSMVENKGFVAAKDIVVQQFLSTDQTWSTDDLSLGSFTVASLAASGSDSRTRNNLEIPPHVVPGTWYVGLVVDPANAITELNETNNVTFQKITVTAPACFTRLSYRDANVYPVYDATISGVKGGQLLPTVTSPCDAGKGYIIVWGFSGTSPGIPVGPSLTVPLNWDAWTTVAYAAINGQELVSFRGTLDSRGIGRATLKVPPKSYDGTISGHLAAVVYDLKTGGITGVTNAVAIHVKP